MSWDGMLLKGTICKGCGKELNADGTHPAELYAGTYNGLCYPCTGSKPYVVDKVEGGCKSTSHPPHCPSWRRDRETYIWNPECDNTKCEMGKIRVSRSHASGGPYTIQCDKCYKVWNDSPEKVVERDREKKELDELLESFVIGKKESYEIALTDGVKTVKGHILKVPKYDFTTFGLHGSRNSWTITELTTGLRIVGGSSRDDVLKRAANAFSYQSAESMRKVIDETTKISENKLAAV